MTERLKALATAHGVIACVVLIAWAIAVVVTFRRLRGARYWNVGVAMGGLITFLMGLLLHMPFQSRLRQKLFIKAAAVGWMFERKEHAAFGAVLLSWCAVGALWAARSCEGDEKLSSAAARFYRAGITALAGGFLFYAFALWAGFNASRHVGF